MAIFPPTRPPDYLYDFSDGYVDGILHGQNGWTDDDYIVDSGRVGILNGKLVCVPTTNNWYGQAWRTDISLADVIVRSEFGPYTGPSPSGNDAFGMALLRNQGNGISYGAILNYRGQGTHVEISVCYKSSYWSITYLGGSMTIPLGDLAGGAYLYGMMEGDQLTVAVTTLSGEVIGTLTRQHLALQAGYIGLLHNRSPEDDHYNFMPVLSVAVWDPANDPPPSTQPTLSDPTTSNPTPTSMTIGVTTDSADGTLYAAVRTAAQGGAYTEGDQEAIRDATVGGDCVWKENIVGPTVGVNQFEVTGLSTGVEYFYGFAQDAGA